MVARTICDREGIGAYLDHVSAPDWYSSDAGIGAELLTEFMGRLCYRSWKPGLNANVTKVREGNREYLANIISSRHGSVLEHGSASFVFADVSRVFTHELVRHRVGAAYSQESLRYVRLTDLGLWLPPEIEQDPQLVELFEQQFRSLEALQTRLAELMQLDSRPFHEKKVLTSAARRVAPIGLATTIGATFNHRTLRHLIELRTAESAESEIRYVFGKVAAICMREWPNIYQDFERNAEGEWLARNSKV